MVLVALTVSACGDASEAPARRTAGPSSSTEGTAATRTPEGPFLVMTRQLVDTTGICADYAQHNGLVATSEIARAVTAGSLAAVLRNESLDPAPWDAVPAETPVVVACGFQTQSPPSEPVFVQCPNGATVPGVASVQRYFVDAAGHASRVPSHLPQGIIVEMADPCEGLG